jgi:hypothetical protein
MSLYVALEGLPCRATSPRSCAPSYSLAGRRELYAYYRDSNETPNCDAFIFVAATVRFNPFEIRLTPTFFFASDFNSRTSDEVQARRTIFFFLAILAAFVGAAL